jgi:putative spermidine/putrescine transport system permease protein
MQVIGRAALLPAAITLGIYGASFATFVLASIRAMEPGGRVGDELVWFKNYERFFGSFEASVTLGQTFLLAIFLTAITMILSYPVAYFIVRTSSSRLRRLLLGVVMVTFLSGGITRAYAWMIVLGNVGLVNRILATLGLDRAQLLYNERGVAIALVHFLLPFCILTLVGAFQSLPRNIEEAASSLGASRLRGFWSVTVPVTAPAATGAAILTFSLAASAFLFPLLLGGGKVRMMSNHIYELIFVAFDIPYAAANAVVFLISTVALIAGLLFLVRSTLGSWSEASGR